MSNNSEKQEIEVIARGVCVKGGRLLVCHTKGALNTYLPGGHIEFGESAKASLRREMKEELGATFTVGRFLGAIEHSYRKKGLLQHEINLVFEMSCRTVREGAVPVSCEDYIEFFWLPLAELAKSQLEPAPLRKAIPKWLSGEGDVVRWAGTV